jgi:hypothetical protein
VPPQTEEAVLNRDLQEGQKELKALQDLTNEETTQLQRRLEKEIELAMKGAELEMLEEYDAKTQALLSSMKKDRDVIREEAQNIADLQEQLKSPLWWQKKQGGAGKDKKSFANTLAPFLAWTFGFAALNEVYSASGSDDGVTFIVGLKTAFDAFLSLVSGFIAFRKAKPAPAGDDEAGGGDA